MDNPLQKPPMRRASTSGPAPAPSANSQRPDSVMQRRKSTLHKPTEASLAHVNQRSVSVQGNRRLSISRPASRLSYDGSRPGSRAGAPGGPPKLLSSSIFVVLRPTVPEDRSDQRAFTVVGETALVDSVNEVSYTIDRGVDMQIDIGMDPMIALGLQDRLDSMFATERGKILLLQGPSSGGKSSFLYGHTKSGSDGYLSFALSAALRAKASSPSQLHVLLQAVEVREDDKVYDLLGSSDTPITLKTKGTMSNKRWYPATGDVLVADSAKVAGLLSSIANKLMVQGNGVHEQSSRGFALYNIKILVGSLAAHKRNESGVLVSMTDHQALSFNHWVVDTPGSEPLPQTGVSKTHRSGATLNPKIMALQTALRNTRSAIHSGTGTPAGVSSSVPAKLLCYDLMQGCELYTVLCLPPAPARHTASINAIDFAVSLQLAETIHVVRSTASQRVSTVAAPVLSAPIPIQGSRPAASAVSDLALHQQEQVPVSNVDWQAKYIDLLGKVDGVFPKMDALESRVRILELEKKLEQGGHSRLDFSVQETSTPVSQSIHSDERSQRHRLPMGGGGIRGRAFTPYADTSMSSPENSFAASKHADAAGTHKRDSDYP